MPLIKHVAKVEEAKQLAQDVATEVLTAPLEQQGAPAVAAVVEKTKAVYTGRKATVSKEDYWANREERDIVKDKHIRLSGVLQAVLQSVNFGQYCSGTTSDEYLVKVEAAALRLAKFVTEKAE